MGRRASWQRAAGAALHGAVDPFAVAGGVAPAAAPAGGSFLRTAMATAAGVAGGALLFQGISSLMGSNPFGGQQQAAAQPGQVPDAQEQQQATVQDDSQMADGGACGGATTPRRSTRIWGRIWAAATTSPDPAVVIS